MIFRLFSFVHPVGIVNMLVRNPEEEKREKENFKQPFKSSKEHNRHSLTPWILNYHFSNRGGPDIRGTFKYPVIIRASGCTG